MANFDSNINNKMYLLFFNGRIEIFSKCFCFYYEHFIDLNVSIAGITDWDLRQDA